MLFCFQYLTYAQCTCSLQVTATKKNAVLNCTNGAITVFVNGNICGSLTLAKVTIKDSATSAIIQTQYVSQVPGFVYFSNVPAGHYKIVATHPCSTFALTYLNVPAVISDPGFNSGSIDVYVHGCNNGAIGLEITGDYCPSTLNILCQDTLPPYTQVTFTQTSYCSFCYLAENLRAGVYKVDVYDSVNPVHHIDYVTISEPPCNFYISANQGRSEACVKENIVVHLLGDYCLSNTFTLKLYNAAMVLKDSIINQVLNDTLVHFNNLNAGTYTVSVTYADSCTSSATVIVKKFCPVPYNLNDSIVDSTSRMLQWSGYSCLTGYELSYRPKGTTAWQIITITGASNTSATITGLTSGSTYQWRVKSKCTATLKSLNSAIKTFKVSNANRLLSNFDEQNIVVKPNPTDDIFNVSITVKTDKPITESFYSNIGSFIFSRKNCSPDETYNITGYPKGIYLLRVENGSSVITRKIILN